MVIAKLGDKSELPVVESCFKDTDVIVNNGQTQTQVRDIALVVAIHLHGQDPKDFGFQRAALLAMPYYNPGAMGFRDESERN